MTQSIIEKLEALPQYILSDSTYLKFGVTGAVVAVKDLSAIIEQAKAEKQETGGKAVIKIHPEGWEYGEEPAGEPYTGEPVAVLALKNTELSKRVAVLEDLLSSAYTIANRKGIDTHWFRFAAQLHINGISQVTAKTFKILPSDPEYTTTQPDIVAELVKALEETVAIAEAHITGLSCTGPKALLAKAKEMMG